MANVTEPEVYMKRIADLLGDEFVDGKLQPSLDVASVDEANQKIEKIDQQQEQLRQMRGEIDQNEEYIHEGYEEAEVNVKPTNTSYWRGFFGGLFGRRDKEVARKRENLSHGEVIALQPFDAVKQKIDDFLSQLDDAKLTLTNYISENK